MRHVTAEYMLSFLDELEKTAGWGETLGRAATRVGTALAGSGPYGARLALAGGLGAGGGALVDEQNRLRGALIGGALGAGTMGGAILSTPAGRKAFKEGSKNWWQRQKYSLTGRGVKDLDEAQRIGVVAKKPIEAEVKDPAAYQKALRRHELEREAYEKGYLHVPGLVKGMVHPGDVLRSGWQRTGALGKAFAGLGAYEAGRGFIQKPKEGEPGRLERGLRNVGNVAGILVAPPIFGGGLVVGEGLSQAGKYLGRGGGRLIGRIRGRQQPSDAGTLMPMQTSSGA